jgi:hypothetical protein
MATLVGFRFKERNLDWPVRNEYFTRDAHLEEPRICARKMQEQELPEMDDRQDRKYQRRKDRTALFRLRTCKRISMSFLLPSAVFEQHIILLGKTGSGKSSVIRLMEEHLLDLSEPTCTIDPKGDHWGIKASASGKQAGYPVVIFGGEHGDVPLNSRSGAAVAELAATGNRPCIIDLGGWMPGAMTEFWIDFASTFFRLARGRRYLIIDEVHNFCPKGKILDPSAGRMLHWSKRLASEGRGKGINLIAASQRPQKVHNDFLTSCETLVAMRVLHKSDRMAVKDWIDGCGDEEKGKAVLTSLGQMKRGEAWVWSPEAEFGPKHIKFPMFSTYDSFKPQRAAVPVKLKGWADVDLAEISKKLEAAVKEAEANDPKKLQAKIRELQSELAKAGKQKLPIVTEKLTKVKVSAAEIRRVLHEEIEPWRKFGQDVRRRLVDTIELLTRFGSISLDIANKAGGHLKELGAIPDYPVLHPDFKAMKAKVHEQTRISTTSAAAPSTHREDTRPHHQTRATPSGAGGTWNGERLPEGEKEVLIAIASYQGGVERKQLTVLTGYKRSTRDAYVARLKPKGLIEFRGDIILATESGIAALGSDYRPQPLSGAELQEYWMAELPEGEKKILQLLIAEAGKPLDRDRLDEATGFARSSRDAYISRLGAKRLVESVGRGQVRASASLFA